MEKGRVHDHFILGIPGSLGGIPGKEYPAKVDGRKGGRSETGVYLKGG